MCNVVHQSIGNRHLQQISFLFPMSVVCTQIYTVYTGCVFYLMDTILGAELLIFMVMLMISTSLRRIHCQGLSTLM